MTDSYIALDSQSRPTTFAGPDATKLYQAMVLKSSLKLYAATGMIPTRGVTITRMLTLAGSFCGKTYKRGDARQAAADLQIWIDAMKCAIPIQHPAPEGFQHG